MAKKVCVISFSDLKFDARSLNLINTLVEVDGIELHTISIGKQIDNVDYLQTKFDLASISNSWVRWYEFIEKIKICNFPSNFDYVFICDLYCLPAIPYLTDNNSFVVYDSREIYSKLASLKGKPIRQMFVSFIERKFAPRADLILTSGKLDTEYLKEKLFSNSKFLEVYNFPPYKEYIKSKSLQDEFALPESARILLYQGVIHNGRGLDEAINTIELLPNDYVLCVVGDGPYLQHYKQIVKSKNLNLRVFFTGFIAYNELHSYSCSADLGLCLFQPISFSYQLALPNKLFEYAMAGLPVLATNLLALSEVLNKFQYGKTINAFPKSKDLADAIEDIFDNNFADFKTNALEAAKINCYESQKDIILQILNRQRIKN